MVRVHLATAGLVAVLVVVMAPVAAEAAPTATVTPSTGLVELQQVTVSGSGFGGSVDVYMCQAVDSGSNSPDPNYCGGFIASTRASASGSYTLSYKVRRFMYVAALGRTVDCVDAAANCIMAVSDYFNSQTLLKVPIAFAPPPSPPTTRGSIAIEPGTATGNELVRVTGSGFRPGATVEVLQCPANPGNPTDCGPAPVDVIVDADTLGSFVTDVSVFEFLRPPTGQVDCVTAVPDCVIAAGEVVDFPRTVVSAPVNIVGAPRPEVSVTPSADLASGQAVTIHGMAFDPSTFLLYCQVTTSNGCGDQPTPSLVTSDDGTFTVQYRVKRFLTDSSGGHDCVTEQCVIRVDGGPRQLEIPISFDPDAPASRPDARLKNRATGAIAFDDQYSYPDGFPPQRRSHAIQPGGFWTFAVQLQNDGSGDNFRVSATNAGLFTIRFFHGYYDITAAVTGAGAVLRNVPPGGVRTIAVQFRAPTSAQPGSASETAITFTSVADGSHDSVEVRVTVPRPPT